MTQRSNKLQTLSAHPEWLAGLDGMGLVVLHIRLCLSYVIFLVDCLPLATVVIALFSLGLEAHDICGSCYRLFAPLSTLFLLLCCFSGWVSFFRLFTSCFVPGSEDISES